MTIEAIEPKPVPDHIAIIKAAQTAAETECQNLLAQLTHSEQFANDLRQKLLRAQGKYEGHTETLKMLEPAAPAAKETEVHDGPKSPTP